MNILLLRDFNKSLQEQYINEWKNRVSLGNQSGIPDREAEKILEALHDRRDVKIGEFKEEVEIF